MNISFIIQILFYYKYKNMKVIKTLKHYKFNAHI